MEKREWGDERETERDRNTDKHPRNEEIKRKGTGKH